MINKYTGYCYMAIILLIVGIVLIILGKPYYKDDTSKRSQVSCETGICKKNKECGKWDSGKNKCKGGVWRRCRGENDKEGTCARHTPNWMFYVGFILLFTGIYILYKNFKNAHFFQHHNTPPSQSTPQSSQSTPQSSQHTVDNPNPSPETH